MKKIIGLIICLCCIYSSQLVLAQGDYYNIDIDTCNELTVSYYNGGEFFNPLRDVYYKYVTNDRGEITDILNNLSDMNLIPFSGGFGASGGEALNIYADGEMIISFHLSTTEKYLCRTSDNCYYFSIDECRKLEDTVLKYKTKNDIKVYLNNEEIRFYYSPVIINDRILVPPKTICDKLGIESSLGIERIVLNQTDKSLVINSEGAYENKTFVPIDVGYQFVDEFPMVPIRKVAEFFGYEVNWENNSVYITTK